MAFDQKIKHRKKHLLVLIVLAVLIIPSFAMANGSIAANTKSIPATSTQTVLNLGLVRDSNIPSLNPLSPVFAVPIDKFLYLPLFYLAFPPQSLIDPILAKNATSNANYTEWTINLKPDLKWDNGQPITSADVSFTLEYYFKEGVIPSAYLIGIANSSSTSTIVTFSQPEPSFEYELASAGGSFPGVLPYSTYQNLNSSERSTITNFNNIIADGPFVIYNYTEGTNPIIFQANKYYYRGIPTMNAMDLHLFSSSSAMVNAYLSGEIAAIWESSSYSSLSAIANVSGHTLQDIVPAAVKVVMFDTFTYPFNLTGVRQALAYATNRSDINARVNLASLPLANYDILINQYNTQVGIPNSSVPTYQYSLSKVSTLMNTSGFSKINGYWSYKNGNPISVNISYSSSDVSDYDIAQILSTTWSNAGFKVNLNGVSSSSLDTIILQKIGWNVIVETDYFIGPLPGPLSNLITPSSPMEFSSSNTTIWWNNTFYNDILNASAYPINSSEQNSYVAKAAIVVARSVPLIPLYYTDNWVGTSNDFYWGSQSNNTGIFNTQAMLQEQFWYGTMYVVKPLNNTSTISTSLSIYDYAGIALAVIVVVGIAVLGVRRIKKNRKL